MIVGYVGPLGSGKSLGMIYDAARWSLKAGGAPIWGNLLIRPAIFEAHRLRNPGRFKIGRLTETHDLIRAVAEGGGLVLFDEIHQTLDARLSLGTQNIFVTQLLVFMRKAGLTPLFTTQHENQVDKRLRGVTDLLTVCRAYGAKGARTHTYTRWDYQGRRPIAEFNLTPDMTGPYFAAYDTHEFTRRLKFPSKQEDFDKLMDWMEEAKDFARSYKGSAQRAWEAFLLQSKHAPKDLSKTGGGTTAKKRVRNPPHGVAGAGIRPSAV